MRKNRLLPFLLVLLYGCAQVAEITGGPMDTEAPELVSASPPHLSTNFRGDRITLVFNERVQLERVRERLLISPPMATLPTVRLGGSRTVIIDLDQELRPNTTYSFGIGEAVKDLTEGNRAAGLTHVISTGPFVDSLVIAGEVTHAFTGLPEKDVLVMVYEVDDTTTIRTGRPAYATRSDQNGRFLLQYLRPGEYDLFALRDQNANYRFDLPNEEIAFLADPVAASSPDTLVTRHQLRLFQEHAATQQIRDARTLPDGPFRLLLERPADTVMVRDIARTGGILQWMPEWNETRDTLLLWPNDTTALETGRYEISTEDDILDTLRYRRLERMPFFTTVQARMTEVDEDAVISLRTSRPITSYDVQRMEVLMDSLPLPMQVEHSMLDPRRVIIQAPVEPGMNVTLRLMPRALTDLYGGHNDTLITSLGRAAEKSTGILRIRMEMLEASEGPYLLQLMDRQGGVAMHEDLDRLDRPVVWERVTPGQYNLRLIEDRNGNGRWDPGILDEGLQPERVWRHKELVNVRASWDLGVDWVIGEAPGKGEGPGDEEEP